YNMIPLMYDAVASLNSQRTIEGTDTFINEDVMFGDCRFRTFTMDDAEWEAYCTKQNNQLKY
ncbi:MAG: hypothetical protein K6F69_05225, partial [Treponema sp.]|nr:hypothetical protein [Treponema sp.]